MRTRSYPPLLSLIAISVALSACTSPSNLADRLESEPGAVSSFEVLPLSGVEWSPLNPARGDKGPKAGTLWGDRTGPGASGFLVEFLDGFESPPHIHNVSYRGSVISGLVHNDDPGADEMWMPVGSFWTQPRGAVHITAAKGRRNLAYIEIEEGPYLVMPVEEEFDSGEAPINVEASNVVWVDPLERTATGVKIAYLWGGVQQGSLHGKLVKLPAGFSGMIRGRGATLRAVVIEGRLVHRSSAAGEHEALEPGSYFGSEGESMHRIACDGAAECVLYVRADGELDLVSSQP